jgi:hypothetical protein
MVARGADFETAIKLMPSVAELARAEGASFHSLAGAAGDVMFAFDGVTDSTKKADKVMEVMRGLGGQGKAGNIDMRQQAKQIGGMVASAGKFEGDNATNILKMGALMQFSRGGGGAISPSTARSAMSAFTNTFGKNARLDKFQEIGHMGPKEIFADKEQTKLRAPEDLIIGALKATGGSIPKMNAMFGSVMGDRAIRTLSNTFTDAEKKQKGTGEKAVRGKFDSMVKDTMMLAPEVTEFASKRMSALDAKMASQQEKFDQAVQEKVIPALLKLVPVLDKMVPLFVDLNAQALPAFVDLLKTLGDFAQANRGIISDIAAHPIGAILALEMGKSIAAAGIGEVVRGVMMKSLGGGIALGAVTIMAELAKIEIDHYFKEEGEQTTKSNTDQVNAQSLADQIARGGFQGTPEEAKAKLQGMIASLEADKAKEKETLEHPGVVKTVTGFLTSLTDGSEVADGPDGQLRERKGPTPAQEDEAARKQRNADIERIIALARDALTKINTANPSSQEGTPAGPPRPPGPATSSDIWHRNKP